MKSQSLIVMNFHKLDIPRYSPVIKEQSTLETQASLRPCQDGTVLSAHGVPLPGFCELLLLAAIVPHDTGSSPGGMWLQFFCSHCDLVSHMDPVLLIAAPFDDKQGTKQI